MCLLITPAIVYIHYTRIQQFWLCQIKRYIKRNFQSKLCLFSDFFSSNNREYTHTHTHTMSHTILLVQPGTRPETRTYSDYESVNECMEGVCKIYEEHLKRRNPNTPTITYDISQLFDFLDQVNKLFTAHHIYLIWTNKQTIVTKQKQHVV